MRFPFGIIFQLTVIRLFEAAPRMVLGYVRLGLLSLSVSAFRVRLFAIRGMQT